MSDDARSAVLSRIRYANHATTDLANAQADWQKIPREYKRSSSLSRLQTLALFVERLRDYDAHVARCTRAEIPEVVDALLAELGLQRIVAPAGFPAECLPTDACAVTDEILSPAELDGFGAAITESVLGIAETGTLALQSVPGQGRRATSLIPDVHLVLIRAEDVVATVPEALKVLNREADLPLTLVSGPSATADIEMTRIKGVHGPRFLYVFILD